MKNNNIRLYFFQSYIFIFISFFFKKIISKKGVYIYNNWKKTYSNTYEKNIE
jgi:hypothetical protein